MSGNYATCRGQLRHHRPFNVLGACASKFEDSAGIGNCSRHTAPRIAVQIIGRPIIRSALSRGSKVSKSNPYSFPLRKRVSQISKPHFEARFVHARWRTCETSETRQIPFASSDCNLQDRSPQRCLRLSQTSLDCMLSQTSAA